MRPVKSGKQHARSKPVKAPAAPAVPVASLVNGSTPTSPATTTTTGAARKKKKKRGKGGGATAGYAEGDLDMETFPAGGELNYEFGILKTPNPLAHNPTTLAPELESVTRLATAASLNPSTAAVRHNIEQLRAGMKGTFKTFGEMFSELHQKNATVANAFQKEMIRSIAEMPGMREFMQRNAAGGMDADTGADSEVRDLYECLQGFFQTSLSEIVSPGTQGTPKTNGAPPQDFESRALSDVALAQTLERLVTGKGSAGTGQGTALHANVVVSHEVYEDEDGLFEDDDVCGGDDGDGNGTTYASGWNIDGTVYCEVDEETMLPGAYPSGEVYPADRERMPVKRPKSRRKVDDGLLSDPVPAGTVTVPAVPLPDTNSNNSPHNITSTPDHSMAPARNAPPPSSRAAGKQPMSYAPTAPAATATNTTNTNPPRSARAAAKAPAPPQSYTNHSHPHHHNPSPPVSNASAPQKHRPPGGSSGGASAKSNNKIWSTNTSEERERIKEFWLGLSEKDRRQLVEIEKETVLKRMKEQQKHSCTCAVCGRKRNAIEEELEVLYDAYYEELEQYANYQQRYASSGGTLPPPPGPGPFPGSVELDKDGLPVGPGKTHTHSHPPSARIKSTNALTNGPKKGMVESEFEEDPDADDYDEDEYEEDEEEDEEDEEDDLDAEDDIEIRSRTRPLARDRNRGGANGKANGRDSIFNFGSSLTVTGPGNILTVADDLLKNDGQKFLEMMEQLAERRMQREEDAARNVEEDSDDEDDEEEDEGEEDEEDEDDEDDDDEEVAMTEEQKIAEGKRMFSIFAARMFEQRVLQAYREKVAQERQKQLLQELEEEENAKSQREAKKAKENQKKKDKKRQQKQAKEEERAAKLAEKAAEEAALKEKQRKLEEEQRKKREEERIKREVARKAAEEERLRKEEERRKRMQEEKEQQAERERKRREKEERRRAEQREREERERKAREEREAKLAAERAEKAKKEQQEKEEREKRLAKEKEEKEKAEREARERQAKEQQQQARSSVAKARAPSSPRVNATASGSRQQQQQNNGAPKKILNKPSNQLVAPVPGPAAPPQPVRQPSRPTVTTPQQSQPPQQNVTSPTVLANVPPSTPTFPQGSTSGNGIPPPMLSPQRPPFPPGPGLPGYGGFMHQMPVPPPLGQSPMARPFVGSPTPFEAGFGRGLAPAAPIGPPPKAGLSNPLASPIMPPGSGAPNRRMSSAADPGPITRPIPIAPIAPIARPTANGVNGDSSGSAPGSGGASPSRRSPSPKGVLGSSALAADDDEVVAMPPTRRVAPGPVGQGWHSPRSSVATATPWASAPPGFSPSRAAPGSNLGGMAGLGVGVGAGPWGAQAQILGNPGAPGTNLNDSWPTHPGTPFFGGSPFVQSHHSAATPPPHSTGN